MNTTDDVTEDQLTAYALGELEGAERERVEAHVARDEPSRRWVEEVRTTARLLTTELSAESLSALLPSHRAAIEQRMYPAPPRAPSARPSRSRGC